MENRQSSQENLVKRYDTQVKDSIKNLEQLQESYRSIKDKLKSTITEKNNLEYKIKQLEEKISLLYSQIESTE